MRPRRTAHLLPRPPRLMSLGSTCISAATTPDCNMRLALGFLLISATLCGQAKAPAPGQRNARWAIRNAIIVEGNGTPAAGPKDILIEGNTIKAIVPAGAGNRVAADVEIDAKGKYVLPGFINLHGHVQEERGGRAQPLDYELKLWLACGITTVRDVGSDTKRTLELRAKSAAGQVPAPRIFAYP